MHSGERFTVQKSEPLQTGADTPVRTKEVVVAILNQGEKNERVIGDPAKG